MKCAPPYSFCDVGSGAGRIVLSASALWGSELWKVCRGVEVAPALAELADEALKQAHASKILRCRVDLQHASWDDADLEDVDLAFAYSTAYETNGDGELEQFATSMARKLKLGAVLVTVDHPLKLGDGAFRELERRHGAGVYGSPGLGADVYIYERTCPAG